jgi:hypothetical protein
LPASGLVASQMAPVVVFGQNCHVMPTGGVIVADSGKRLDSPAVAVLIVEAAGISAIAGDVELVPVPVELAVTMTGGYISQLSVVGFVMQ